MGLYEFLLRALKRKQPKLEVRGFISSLQPKPCAVFAGAGDDGDLIDVLVDKLWRAMEPKGADGLESMIMAAEDELTLQYQRFVPLFPNVVPGTSFFVGIWSGPNEFDLIRLR